MHMRVSIYLYERRDRSELWRPYGAVSACGPCCTAASCVNMGSRVRTSTGQLVSLGLSVVSATSAPTLTSVAATAAAAAAAAAALFCIKRTYISKQTKEEEAKD